MPRFTGLMAMYFLLSALLPSCDLLRKNNEDSENALPKKNWKAIDALMNVDREFAAYSRDSGLKKGYLEYLDEEAVMLRPNENPLEGTYALDFISQLNDRQDDVTWQVQSGDVAASNDMGYTYGIYIVTDKETKDTLQQGTYTMVWKKNKDGFWKVVMDTGNPGLKEEKDQPDEKNQEQ